MSINIPWETPEFQMCFSSPTCKCSQVLHILYSRIQSITSKMPHMSTLCLLILTETWFCSWNRLLPAHLKWWLSFFIPRSCIAMSRGRKILTFHISLLLPEHSSSFLPKTYFESPFVRLSTRYSQMLLSCSDQIPQRMAELPTIGWLFYEGSLASRLLGWLVSPFLPQTVRDGPPKWCCCSGFE